MGQCSLFFKKGRKLVSVPTNQAPIVISWREASPIRIISVIDFSIWASG